MDTDIPFDHLITDLAQASVKPTFSLYTPRKYDIFLSHKQSDAKHFARALYTTLSLRNYSVFLDMEFDGQLCDLTDIVKHSKLFIFVLSNEVLYSHGAYSNWKQHRDTTYQLCWSIWKEADGLFQRPA